MNDFNELFQVDETRASYLLPEMTCLLRKLMVRFVQMKQVKGKALITQQHRWPPVEEAV